jgi:hypothetical protein
MFNGGVGLVSKESEPIRETGWGEFHFSDYPEGTTSRRALHLRDVVQSRIAIHFWGVSSQRISVFGDVKFDRRSFISAVNPIFS